MPKQKTIKMLITEVVLENYPDRNTSKTIDDYIKLWWFTKNGEGLRLNHIGDQAFRDAEIEFYDLPLIIKYTSFYQFLNDCNRKLKCPYYIGTKIEQKREEPNKTKEPFLRLYNSKIAMLVQLYGDIKSYLESVRI